MGDPLNQIPAKSMLPTQATVGGAILGTAIGQVIVAAIEFFAHHAVTSQFGGAITTICIFAATYYIPEKPNLS